MTIPKEIIDFHGHFCPGLAYGYRVSLAALKRFGQRAKDEELVAVVENDSCAVDSIQVATGCTLGKGNLILRDYGKQVYTFFNRSTAQALRISVKGVSIEETDKEKTIWKKFSQGDRSEDVLAEINRMKALKTQRILNADEYELFIITDAPFNPPQKARIHASVICSRCGEKLMEPRAKVKNGLTMCIPCSEA
jgi:formylmethanofuran dehydrogenase subunit E